MPHKRKPSTVADKFEKRLAISQDSFIREAEGVPLDPNLSQPFPVSRAWVATFANPQSFSSNSEEPPLEPHPEHSWGTESMRLLAAADGVSRVEIDMCAFGLQVGPDEYSKKPTAILTNCKWVRRELEGRCCDGTHSHLRLEGVFQRRLRCTPVPSSRPLSEESGAGFIRLP